jgi:molecular chaperone DnaK
MYNQGRELVGWPAYRAMMENHPEEGVGYTGYKLRIGQNDVYRFMSGKKTLTAPELGARVIRELLRAYQEDRGQDPADLPKACVITVPAIFDQSATDGTREAARLAGLRHYPLLQEPIAASLAYGFTASDDRGQWIVFDIGAGTLDISLVIVRKGQMIVPEEGHAGDDRLGGRKFDSELLDFVISELGKTYALDGFASNPKFEQARNRLLLAVERAKIELSKREQAVVELDEPPCKDLRGKPVEVMVPVTRQQYEKLITPDIEKAVQVCQTLIARNRLKSTDISRIILVGGPSRTPYLQRTLTGRFQIPLECSIDPMTAVAQGAAIYSATAEVPEDVAPQILVPVPSSGETSVQMEYQAYSKVPTYEVAGRISGPAVAQGDLTVRFAAKMVVGQVVEFGGRYRNFFCNVMLAESAQPKFLNSPVGAR